MCGLFGFVRSTRGAHPKTASGVFADLGRLAERRGRDAAGFALVQPSQPPAVVKATWAFSGLWRSHHAPMLHQASLALGHTRHASQGAPGRLANAHPLETGGLIGTVNGDIDQGDLRRCVPPGLPAPQGETDSEVLLLALNRARGDLEAVCEVLAAVRGVVALAWVDRAQPDRVFLARGALCPLAIARDTQGHLYWASSPTWFHRLDEQAGGWLGFQVERVAEGTVLVIATGDAALTVVAERSFTPTARAGDAQRFPSIWAGLDRHEAAAFQAETRHRVAPPSNVTHMPGQAGRPDRIARRSA
jgi:glucosamine 6-phosphate synthetase-like amidotransferase/phosphosugar isomerase protein